MYFSKFHFSISYFLMGLSTRRMTKWNRGKEVLFTYLLVSSFQHKIICQQILRIYSLIVLLRAIRVHSNREGSCRPCCHVRGQWRWVLSSSPSSSGLPRWRTPTTPHSGKATLTPAWSFIGSMCEHLSNLNSQDPLSSWSSCLTCRLLPSGLCWFYLYLQFPHCSPGLFPVAILLYKAFTTFRVHKELFLFWEPTGLRTLLHGKHVFIEIIISKSGAWSQLHCTFLGIGKNHVSIFSLYFILGCVVYKFIGHWGQKLQSSKLNNSTWITDNEPLLLLVHLQIIGKVRSCLLVVPDHERSWIRTARLLLKGAEKMYLVSFDVNGKQWK